MKSIRNTLRTAIALALLTGLCASAQEGGVVHISQADAMKAAKERVDPQYPPMAKQLHLEGAVELEAHIGEDGIVGEVRPLTGNAVLMNAAVAAIKKWKFTPIMADGKPTKAVADLSFHFKL
jgi:periplasmic protein TonB